MTLEEFEKKYAGFTSHQNISIKCERCDKECSPTKTRAKETLKAKGRYYCRPCGILEHYERNPMSEERKEKHRQGRLGYVAPPETRVKMSASANRKFSTPEGQAQKKRLAKLAVEQHARGVFKNTRRRGLFSSKLNGGKLIPFNSSYELRYFTILEEQSETVAGYESQIAYEVDGRARSLDVRVDYKDGRTMAVEIKPAKRLEEFADQLLDSRTNAARRGWLFEIVTEKELGFATEHEATKWADEYMTQLGNVDYVAHRKQRNREKARKHYEGTIRGEKVTIRCRYCNEDHTILAVSYNSNLQRNGRYICHKENADKPKPKKKRVDPYAALGMKVCAKCERILPFEMFGADKSRADGYSSRCKECRNQDAMSRYRSRRRGTEPTE